jgi:putative acyl-CoA dehydrogenase
MPVNSIWEGAGNIMALDLLRALRKGGDVADALMAELAPARGTLDAFDRFADTLPNRIDEAAEEADGRRLAQDVALGLQAALLKQHAPEPVFEAFCASRLQGDWGHSFGSLSSRTDFDALITRALPR